MQPENIHEVPRLNSAGLFDIRDPANFPLLLFCSQRFEPSHSCTENETSFFSMSWRMCSHRDDGIHGFMMSFAGVSVHISSHHLRQILQDNTDNSTAPYFKASDFVVTKDSNSCYESIWTLTWKKKTGDLPNVISVQ